jgi:two-component sensor histidine kinase
LSKATERIARLPLMQARPAGRATITVALCVMALGARALLGPYFPPGYPFVTFFPAVIVSSFLFGARAGALAGLLCGLFAWYFFIPPFQTLTIDQATLIAMAFYTGVVVVDVLLIHWMQGANHRLHAAREEGRRLAEESARLAARTDLLFQELQHRVGNNLQMVAAVLSMQLRGLEEPTARRAISDAVQRVQVIGSIQRRLYRSNGELVPLDDFVGEVCDQLMISSGRPGITCSVKAASGLVLPPDAAVPMALILAEALANAMEHGFVDRDAGRVDVVLEHEADHMTLQVRDNGAGLPRDFDIGQADSLGLRISRVLSRQLGATYVLEDAGPGCRMQLTVPAARFAPHVG